MIGDTKNFRLMFCNKKKKKPTGKLASVHKSDLNYVGWRLPVDRRIYEGNQRSEFVVVPHSKGTNKHKIKSILQPEILR